jgi:hypothetical protein
MSRPTPRHGARTVSMPRLLLAFIAAATLAAADLPRHVATIPVGRQDEDARARHAATLADPARNGAQIVFLGDSITEMWASDNAGSRCGRRPGSR